MSNPLANANALATGGRYGEKILPPSESGSMSAVQRAGSRSPFSGYGLPQGTFAAGCALIMLVHQSGDIVPSRSGRSGSAT